MAPEEKCESTRPDCPSLAQVDAIPMSHASASDGNLGLGLFLLLYRCVLSCIMASIDVLLLGLFCHGVYGMDPCVSIFHTTSGSRGESRYDHTIAHSQITHTRTHISRTLYCHLQTSTSLLHHFIPSFEAETLSLIA